MPVEIRDRHSGKLLVRWHFSSTRGIYLGHRVPRDLRSANLRGMDLREVDLAGRDLSDADLTGADLTGARYDARTQWPIGFAPQLHGAVQVPVDLRGARLHRGSLAHADLTGADLRGALLTEADFSGARLVGANLRGANLCGADLTEADLSGADLIGVKHDVQTRWPLGFDLEAQVAGLTARASELDLEQLVAGLKVLADKSRLRLLGLLSQDESTVEELAAALDLREPTVSHHLARLKEQELVQMREEGSRHLYRLDREQLTAVLRDLPLKAVQVAQSDLDRMPFERKVLQHFFENGRLKEIPARARKLIVVLQRLVEEFEVGVQYPEAQVNETLKRFHPDCATLRRQLVDHRLMARKNNVYWRISAVPDSGSQSL